MSKPQEITYEVAMAAARDAGNRSMRQGNRTAWAVKDWNTACAEIERLHGVPSHELDAKQPKEQRQ